MLAKMPAPIRRRFESFYAEEERRMREAQRQGLIAPLPFDRLILAATALVHGLAHLIINGATEATPGDVEHAVRLARDVTAVFGAGVFPRYTAGAKEVMRIATWNVNSLAARLEKVTWWLERAQPDVLLMQETKLADADMPRDEFRSAGATSWPITARAAGTASRSRAGAASPT